MAMAAIRLGCRQLHEILKLKKMNVTFLSQFLVGCDDKLHTIADGGGGVSSYGTRRTGMSDKNPKTPNWQMKQKPTTTTNNYDCAYIPLHNDIR